MNINLTENSFIYQSAKRLLNRELEKCTKLLKDNEEAWNEYMDLKLHDASTENIDFEYNDAQVVFTDEAQNNWFYRFCESEYDCFIEWCKSEGIDFDKLRENVGRTSSFYLGKLYNKEKDKYLVALYEAVDLNSSWLEFKEVDGVIKLDEEETNKNFENTLAEFDIEQMVNYMLGLTETVYDDLNDKLKDIIKVYDYIKAVKDDQIESFKSYVRENWIND